MKERWRQTLILSLQSLGVVYGVLSTAPLYVFGTISTDDFASVDVVYEYFSFIFWTLTIISLVKYVLIVLEADDDGEGGTFVLYTLLCRHSKVGLLPNNDSTSEMMHHDGETSCNIKFRARARKALEKHRNSHYLLLFLVLIGACMIIGDGVITPSISVRSASTSLQLTLSDIRCKTQMSDLLTSLNDILVFLLFFSRYKFGEEAGAYIGCFTYLMYQFPLPVPFQYADHVPV